MARHDDGDLSWAYRIFELEAPASREQVKRAYRLLQMVWHPDRFGDNHANRTAAEKKCRDLNRAWEILGSGLVDPPVPKDRRQKSRKAPAAEPDEKPKESAPPRPDPPPPPPKRERTQEPPRRTTGPPDEQDSFVAGRPWFSPAPVLVVVMLFAAVAGWFYASSSGLRAFPQSTNSATNANDNKGQVAAMPALPTLPAPSPKPAISKDIENAPLSTGAKEAFGAWLEANPDFRAARLTEFKLMKELQRDNPSKEKLNPQYVSADLNGDREGDFAALVVVRKTNIIATVVFNGPDFGAKPPQVIRETYRTPDEASVDVSFHGGDDRLPKGTYLLIGSYASDDLSVYAWKKGRYVDVTPIESDGP